MCLYDSSLSIHIYLLICVSNFSLSGRYRILHNFVFTKLSMLFLEMYGYNYSRECLSRNIIHECIYEQQSVYVTGFVKIYIVHTNINI